MRRGFLSVIIVLFILSISSMALAAVSPFSYVPIDNWTYNAFSKLAASKIIENYNDGKVMTRFEMAQLVASAQTRADMAEGENKAIIGKLSTEFATELKMLDNLPNLIAQSNAQQKAQPNAKPQQEYGKIKMSGTLGFGVAYARNFGAGDNRYASTAVMNELLGDPQRTTFRQDLNLGLESQLSDNLTYFTLWTCNAGNRAVPIDIGWKVNFLKYKTDNATWMIGRLGGLPWEPMGQLGQGLLRTITANDDGVGVQFGDKKTAIYQVGYVKKGSLAGPHMTKEADARFMINPNLQLSLAYVSDDHFYNTLGVGFNYAGKDFNVVGEYGKNRAPVSKQAISGTPIKPYSDSYDNPKGWFLEVNTGNLNIFKEGTKKYALRYKSFQPGFDVLGYGGSPVTEYWGSNGSAKNQSDWKGIEFRYSYMIKKQLQYSMTLSKTTNYIGDLNKDWATSYITFFF